MGLQQGVILRDSLHDFVKDYLHERILFDHRISPLGLQVLVRLLERDIPLTLRREIQGIADGAGLPYRDMLLLNAVPELLTLAHWMHLWELSPLLLTNREHTFSFGAQLAAWGSTTMDNELVVGHSAGCPDTDILRQHLLITVRRPSQGNAFAAVGLAGTVGVWAGMNEEKIVATLSSSPSVDVASRGQPLSFVLRQTLERAGDLTEAMDLMLAPGRLYGGNVILGDGKAPKAIVIEASANRHAVFEPEADSTLVVRTNHFLDPELALIQHEVLPGPEKAASKACLTELHALLAPHEGWIGAREGLAFLRNDHASSGQGEPSDSAQTLHSVLFYPGKLAMWVAPDNVRVSHRSHISLDLNLSLLGDR